MFTDTPPQRHWLHYEAASAYLGMSVRQLERLVRLGLVGHTKLGRNVRFSQEQLDAYLEANTFGPTR